MSLPNPDANNIGRYNEALAIGAKFTDYLNKALEAVSAAFTLVRARLTALEPIAWVTPTLGANTTQSASGSLTRSRTRGDAVDLQICVDATASATFTICTLPAGHRPPAGRTHRFAGVNGATGAFVLFQVNDAGVVTCGVSGAKTSFQASTTFTRA